MKHQFFVEMTDTFSGEANYSWVNRFLVKASTMRGAIRKVTHATGYPAKMDYSTGDLARYNVPGCALCYFVSWADGEELKHYSHVKEL